MKKLTAMLCGLLCVGILSGCTGTPVVYHAAPGEQAPQAQQPATQWQGTGTPLKTGLYLTVTAAESATPSAEQAGEVNCEATMVAVLVDDQGVICDCRIDELSTGIQFDAAGQIISDETAPLRTKNELGDDYGMMTYGGAIAEWYQQAASLASYAVGKTPEQLRAGAIDESGYAPAGSPLASSATIYLGDLIAAIEAAAKKAEYLGAHTGDLLQMKAQATVINSLSAAEGQNGKAQLDVSAAAITVREDTVTSVSLEQAQSAAVFDNSGSFVSTSLAAD